MSQATPPTISTTTQNDIGTRYYVSDFSDHKYMLPADDQERQRLNEQSQTINESFDNKLIWAPITLKDGDIVLDSGAGSGHWLLCLSKELPPTIHLRGIDISNRMFPPTTPPNTTFLQTPITSLPADWSNTITLINQRLLVVALQPPEWKAALSEMYRTLIPGGYVQLFELCRPLQSPSKEIREHKALDVRDKLCFEIRHVAMDVTDHLQTWLEECGFVNVTVYKRPWPMGSWAGDHGARSLKACMAFFKAIRVPVMQAGGLGLVSSGEEYDALVDDLTKRCDETPDSNMEYWAFIAQKPVA